MSVSELLRLAHPDSIYRRVDLPADQNALGPWQSACEVLVNRDEIAALASSFDGECDCGESACLACHPIEPAERDARIRDQLAANAAAIEHLDEGLRRGRLQVPPVSGPSDFDSHMAVACQFRELGLLKSLEARLAVSNKDFAVAVRLIADLLQIGGMVCRGEGLGVQFLIGIGFQGYALAVVNEPDLLAGATRIELRGFQDLLERTAGTADLAQTRRIEFTCWMLPTLAKLPQAATLEQVVDGLIDSCCTSNRPTLLEPDDEWHDDGRLAKRREQILELLAQHRRPYVQAETVRLLSGQVAQSIAELRGDAKSGEYPTLSIDTQMWWPLPLAPWVPYDLLGNSRQARQSRREYKALNMQIFPRSGWLTQRQMRLARRNVNKVYNPVGLLLVECLSGTAGEVGLRHFTDRVARTRESLDQLIAQADK